MQNVILGLSGGVDSAVAGHLLKQAGYNVRAVFMVNWKERGSCNWEDDLISARRVAKRLNIPLEIWDFAKEYQTFVFKDFISLYKKGMTPNPDVFCNKYIKFGAFYDQARKEGADYVATGHYARTQINVTTDANQRDQYQLLSAVDETKDQSDFLYQIKQSQLRHILFPIGGMLKSEVKVLAKTIGLPNWNRPESMGVCFIGEMNMKRFLQTYIKSRGGIIVDTEGRELGKHDGVWYYTLGQREGLRIGGSGPYFIVQKDTKRNRLVVAKEPEAGRLLMVKKVFLSKTNFFLEMTGGVEVLWRDRHLSPLQKGTLRRASASTKLSADRQDDKGEKIRWVVEFEKPKRAVVPGQSLVMYDLKGESVIGGGVITKTNFK